MEVVLVLLLDQDFGICLLAFLVYIVFSMKVVYGTVGCHMRS